MLSKHLRQERIKYAIRKWIDKISPFPYSKPSLYVIALLANLKKVTKSEFTMNWERR